MNTSSSPRLHKPLSLALVVLSIIGIADSSYLTYEHIQGIVPPCAEGFACEKVLSSSWASIGPVPVSGLGMIFYLSVFLLSIMLYLKIPFQKLLPQSLKRFELLQMISVLDLLIIASTVGFAFSLFLISIMAFVLQAWCQFCLLSAASSISIWLVAVILVRTQTTSSPFLRMIIRAKMKMIYQWIIKPILFLLPADTVHAGALALGEFFSKWSIGRTITSLTFHGKYPHTSYTKDGINFPSRVGLSAGFDYKAQMYGISPYLGFGFHTIGSVTAKSNPGNPSPQLGRYPDSQALWVNKGLKSDGVDELVHKLQGVQFEIPTGISIANTNQQFDSLKSRILDYLYSFYVCEQSNLHHSYYELNISCPNTVDGEPFSKPENLAVLLRALEQIAIRRPIYLKMPIDKTPAHTLEILNVASQSKLISGVILGNLTKDRTNPAVLQKDRADWSTKTGNLSGKPTWERSNNLIKLTKKYFGSRFTIIGTGGIFSGQDARTKLELGADLVQLITGMIFTGPQVIDEINWELSRKK